MLSLVLASGLAHAAIELTATSSGTALNNRIELLEDVGAQLTIRDMADPAVNAAFNRPMAAPALAKALTPGGSKSACSAQPMRPPSGG